MFGSQYEPFFGKCRGLSGNGWIREDDALQSWWLSDVNLYGAGVLFSYLERYNSCQDSVGIFRGM